MSYLVNNGNFKFNHIEPIRVEACQRVSVGRILDLLDLDPKTLRVHTLGEIRGAAVAVPVGPASPETPGRRGWGWPPEMRRRGPGLSQGRAQALAPGELRAEKGRRDKSGHHEESLFIVCACICAYPQHCMFCELYGNVAGQASINRT